MISSNMNSIERGLYAATAAVTMVAISHKFLPR